VSGALQSMSGLEAKVVRKCQMGKWGLQSDSLFFSNPFNNQLINLISEPSTITRKPLKQFF